MPIRTDTPNVRPPTAEDMLNNGFAGPPAEFAAGPAPRPDYKTAEEAFRAEGAAPALGEFASTAMETPSRYDSGLIKDITAQIDAELEQKKLYAGTELDEFMSQRGMVGSSVEGELRKSMLGDMERQRQERLNELNIRAADTWAADRAGAAEIGFKSAEFERALGGDRENAARYEAEFGQSQYEFDKQYGVNEWSNRIEERRLELMDKGMTMDDAYRMAMSEIQKEQFTETLTEEQAQFAQRHGIDLEALNQETRRIENEETGLSLQEARDKAEIKLRLAQLEEEKYQAGQVFEIDRERIRIQNEQFADRMGLDQKLFEEQRTTRIATIGLDQAALDQAAERLQLDAFTQGRTLNLQEARDAAEMEFRVEELSQTMGLEDARLQAQNDQFQAQHDQNAEQWAENLGLERDQYAEAVEAREAEYSDRVLARTAEMGLQEGSLEHDTMQNSLNRTLEREAHALQERGLDEESAWRLADRNQQALLENRALKIQEDGLSHDAAWRQALNDSNERMAAAQLTSQETLMELGIAADVARDITRESHESAMNAANIASTENIEKLARTLQMAGIDAETAWRAASDASNEAMNNANNAAQETLQTSLLESNKTLQDARITSAETMQTAGIDAEIARDLSRSIHETAMNAASLTSAEDIAAANNTAQSNLQTALLESNKTLQAARITSAETMQTAGIDANTARDTTRELHETAIQAAGLTSAAEIADANNTARDTLQTALQKAGIDAAEAAALAKAQVDLTFATAREAAATTAASTKATVDETFATARETYAETAATAQQLHETSMNTANNTSRETIQGIIKDTVGLQIAAEESWRQAALDHEASMHDEDLAMAQKELDIKEWATTEDLNQRAWEFENSNNTERLKMVLLAITSDHKPDATVLDSWLTQFAGTSKDSTLTDLDRRKIAEMEKLIADYRIKEDLWDEHWADEHPDKCPAEDEKWDGKKCVKIDPDKQCDEGSHWDDDLEKCVEDDESTECDEGWHWDDDLEKCVEDDDTTQCDEGSHWDDDLEKCVEDEGPCDEGPHWTREDGICVNKCRAGRVWNTDKNTCDDIEANCPPDKPWNPGTRRCDDPLATKAGTTSASTTSASATSASATTPGGTDEFASNRLY